MEPLPLFDLRPINDSLRKEFQAVLDAVLDDGNFTGGSALDEFEAGLAQSTGLKHAVAVNSGTAALTLMLLASGIGSGDEVIVPAATFFASAEAIVHAGAEPVPADVDDTACISLQSVRDLITDRTAAILAVDLYGQPADYAGLRQLCDRHNLLLFQDAAQSFGAEIDGRPVGALANATATSFYPTKNLGALGDGGAVLTNDAEWARRVRALRSHGQFQRDQHTMYGFTERMDALQAGFLTVKLRHFLGIQDLRRSLGWRYRERLSLSGVRQPAVRPGVSHAFHLVTCNVENRTAVRQSLSRQGVQTSVHYPTPLHLQPAYRGRTRKGDLPGAEEWAATTLTLPFSVGMADEQVDEVVAMVSAAC